MSRCIFCLTESGSFTTREHILPESLGGGDWAVLPPGLFCDSCQNRFGSAIEQQTLGDYPFSFFRTFLGIPTKKGKPPWFESWQGALFAGPSTGMIGFSPVEALRPSFLSQNSGELILKAEPKRPDMVCRALLKMALETIAADDPDAVFDRRFDPARTFALKGEKKGRWWYLQHEDMLAAAQFLQQGVTSTAWGEGVGLSVHPLGDGVEVFRLQLLYLDILVPLETRVMPPPDGELPEPEFRVFMT